MAKNLIPEVCKILGVEVGEEFKIKNDYTNRKYKIYGDGCIRYEDLERLGWINTSDVNFDELIRGDLEIIKLPWKPKLGKKYWTFSSILFKNSVETTITWEVDSYEWYNAPCEFALFDKGWVYRTKEEAEAALPKIAEKLGVMYEL